MYKTRLGRLRATRKQRIEAISLLKSLPIIFTCTCNQCGCGGFDTVKYTTTYYCPACGRVRRTDGSDKHTPFCHHKAS